LHPGLSRRPLFPVRPDVGADHAALGADHPRAELAHEEIAWLLVDVEDYLVPAAEARDCERPHAVLAHVGQVNRLDLVLRRERRHQLRRLIS
jgi:predicted short-subunit dehydrogenase-like oxidoreductase (DUF2520 family)